MLSAQTNANANVRVKSPKSTAAAVEQPLPKVIVMGDANQTQFEKMYEEYEKLLLTACGNDVNKAALAWNQLSRDLEAFGTTQNFELDGLKIWVQVLFNTSGKIDFVAYHLKPGSRFVKPDQLTPILEKFFADYQIPVSATFKFSQYGSLVFPSPK
jgi:hypothetical protein